MGKIDKKTGNGQPTHVKNRAGGPSVTDQWHVRFAHRQPIFEHPEIPQIDNGLAELTTIQKMVEFHDFKTNELYANIRVPDKPFFVRLDGWNFHGLTKKLRCKRPFDLFLTQTLAATAAEFFPIFNPVLCYLFSDELSFLFLKPTAFTRVEKIDSVFAGLFSSRLYHHLRKKLPRLDEKIAFDCRVIPVEQNEINGYLAWRQAECFRNFNNGYAQHVLLQQGTSPRKVDNELRGLNTKELRALIRKKIGFKKVPVWQERGVLLHWQKYRKKGYDPIARKKVVVERRKVIVDWKVNVLNSPEWMRYIQQKIKKEHSKNI